MKPRLILVPAAAVRRGGQALSFFIGRKGFVGSCKSHLRKFNKMLKSAFETYKSLEYKIGQ